MATRTYTAQIDADAPAADVWALMADVTDWPSWTPTVTSVQSLDGAGAIEVGRRYRVRQPRLPVAVWTVDEVRPGVAFTWSNRSPGLQSTASHRLEPTGDGGTRITLELIHNGPVAGILAGLLGALTQRYVDTEARSLAAASAGGAAGV